MPKITKRSVDAAAPADKEFFVWDDELKGFGLRVYPSGRKMYLAQFRAGGRLRRVNIGLHGALTPDLARTEAMKHLADVRLGADPAGERDRRKASPTMKEFGQRFLDEHVDSHCKPSTHGEYKRLVELFINPKLGSDRIIDVARADVVGLHQAMKATPYQANRTLGVLSIMFTVAHTWGVRTDERHRLDLHQHLAGARLRDRDVAQSEVLAAKALHLPTLHRRHRAPPTLLRVQQD